MLRKIMVSLMLTLGLISMPATISPAFAAETASPVIDNSGLFDATQEQAIVDAFAADHEASGLVFVLETVDTINGQNLQNYTINRANQLGVGDAEQNNGVFMLIVKNDRLFQIEPGTGVSSVVSAPSIQSVVDNIAIPAFKSNDYVGGVIDSAAEVTNKYVSPLQSTSANPIDWSSITNWFLIVLGIFLFVVVAYFVINLIVKRRQRVKQKKAQALEDNRYHQEQETIQKMQMSSSFKNAANSEERYKIIRESLADYLEKDPDFEKKGIKEIHDTTSRLFLVREIANAQLSRWAVEIAVSDMDNYSINEYFGTTEFKSAIDDAHKVVAEKKRRFQEEERKRAKAEAEKQRQRKQNEKDAKSFWRHMPSSAKKQVISARSRSERQRVMEQYNTSGMDMNVIFPILVSMYIADASASSASGYSGSSSSSSNYSSSSSHSSSSSYTSYDSGSSFSGGSFDGGGGGGSW